MNIVTRAGDRDRTNRKTIIGLLVSTISLLLSACGAQASPVPAATATQLLASATATLEPLPSATQPPTLTPAPTALPPVMQDGNGATMQLVPAGAFTMGGGIALNASPAHEVFLDAYYIDQLEVTNGQYAACVEQGKCKPPAKTTEQVFGCTHSLPPRITCEEYDSAYYASEKDYPVIYVDWDMAETYCEWRGAALPTEAQWEKAARGTDKRTYPWGETIDCARSNYSKCYSTVQAATGGSLPTNKVSNESFLFAESLRLLPPGQLQLGASPYGAYDMAGNVGEWVADWFSSDYYKNSPSGNPAGPETGTARVYRGGAFTSEAHVLSTTYRSFAKPDSTKYYIGFRCARSVAP